MADKAERVGRGETRQTWSDVTWEGWAGSDETSFLGKINMEGVGTTRFLWL